MFVDENLQFWFARVKVPDDFQEVFTSLFLSIAGAALNCGTKHAPTEKYYQFLTDEADVTEMPKC